MALFEKQKQDWSFDVLKEGEDTTLYIYVEGIPYAPSIEDKPICMARTIDILAQSSGVTKIIFSQKRDYEYDFSQTKMLVEIATIYKTLVKRGGYVSYDNLSTMSPNAGVLNTRFSELQSIIFKQLKADPLGAYVELRRLLRKEKIELDKLPDKHLHSLQRKYVQLLAFIVQKLDETKLVSVAKPYLDGYQVGDRDIYRNLLTAVIRPDFMFTKLMATYPTDGEELASYTLKDDTEVTIFRFPSSIETMYHIIPPEFKLSEDKYELLDAARKIMAEHKPTQDEFTDPERMRQVFSNVGRDLLEELALSKGLKLRDKDLEKLTQILVRYTVGFGLIEVLLQDEKIQDISINSPMGRIPLFIVHSEFDDCTTNIIPTVNEAESWATKLRLISGRPLDEADPILDTELELPSANTRVSVIYRPLNPTGLAYSFRRHRDRPWTLPLFMKHKMINATAAGLLSFLVDGSRTMLIAGTRSAGKSSFLSSLLVEIMRRYRIITIEDTLELPTKSLRGLKFNIQSMKVASSLASGSNEVDASEGIRSTLRLGDSALIVGEIRSKEAVALYEAMRVGAAANVVAGTIHGDSPYGIYDRVVNDIGIPKTSFKATDVIIVANPIKSADGLQKQRRVTQITEVRKSWENDPLLEHGFSDLMKYNAKTDMLEVSSDLRNGDSDVLKSIAANIKEFAGDWDAVWNNIQLRAQIKQTLVDAAEKHNDLEMLEAPFVIESNDVFHLLSEQVRDEVGFQDPKRIYNRWNDWLKRECKKRNML